MAKLNTQRLKTVLIDGESLLAPADARIVDVVPREVTAVSSIDPVSGKSQLIQRSEFNRPLPEGFTTHLTHVSKGSMQPGTPIAHTKTNGNNEEAIMGAI